MERSSPGLPGRGRVGALPRRGGPQPLGGLGRLVDEADLQYCVLHGWRSHGWPAEIDIAITAADILRLEQRLRSSANGQVVQLLEYESGCYCFVLAVPGARDVRFVAVDAAPDFRQEGYIFLAAQELLRRRLREDQMWVAGASAEFAYLLVKKIVKRSLPDHQKARLWALLASLGGDAGAIATQLLGARWAIALIDWMRHADWASWEAHLPHLKRALVWQTIRRDPTSPLRYWVADLGRRWRRWMYPTGLCIAVSGSDADQREAFIAGLVQSLGGAFRHTTVAASRPWWSKGGVVRAALDAVKYLVRIRPHLVRSGLVILDCPADPGRRSDRSNEPSALVHHLPASPDLHFALGDPAGASAASIEQSRLNGMRRSPTGGTTPPLPGAWTVGGSLPAETSVRTARDVVLDYLHRRYMHRRFLWFPYRDVDTLGWLTGILCLSPGDVQFIPSRRTPRVPTAESGATRRFGWLTVKHGRGYLIPLNSRRAAIKSLDLYNAKSLKARLAKWCLGVGLGLGIGQGALRKVELRRRSQAAGASREAVLLDHVAELLGREDVLMAVSLGTPGPHRKPVLLALTTGGKTLAYVKVGSNDITNALVQHEADVLAHLAGAGFNSFDVPRVVHAGWWHGRYVCVQSPPSEGRVIRASERLMRRYVNIPMELATFHVRLLPLTESGFWKRLQRQVEQVSNVSYRAPLDRGLHRVAQALDGERLRFHLAHGDFAPWNMKVFEDTIVLFDWEHAREGASPAWDVFHFTFETLRARRRTPREMCAAFLRDPYFTSSIEEYLASIGSRTPWPHLLSLYLLSRLASRAIDTPGHTPRFSELQALVQLLDMCWEL